MYAVYISLYLYILYFEMLMSQVMYCNLMFVGLIRLKKSCFLQSCYFFLYFNFHPIFFLIFSGRFILINGEEQNPRAHSFSLLFNGILRILLQREKLSNNLSIADYCGAANHP